MSEPLKPSAPRTEKTLSEMGGRNEAQAELRRLWEGYIEGRWTAADYNFAIDRTLAEGDFEDGDMEDFCQAAFARLIGTAK